MKSLLFVLTLALPIAGTAVAQPTDGDVVFASNSGIYLRTATLARPSTLVQLPGVTLQSCKTAYWNTGVMSSDAMGRLYRVNRNGVLVTAYTFANGWATALDVTSRGYAIAVGTSGSTMLNFSETTRFDQKQLPGTSANAICEVTKTGEQFVGMTGDILLKIAADQTVSTLRTLNETPSGLCYLPDVDRVVVTMLSTSEPVTFMTRAGTITKRVWLNNERGNCCTYNENTQQLYIGTTLGSIFLLGNDGSVIKRVQAANASINGIDTWDSQNITLEPASTDVKVRMRFRDSSGKAYCMAASLGLDVGIQVPGAGRLNILPDQLFFLTVCNGFPLLTSNFTGTLTATGAGTGTFKAAIMPVGVPLFISGAVVDPALPGGLGLANTEVYVK